MARKRGLKEALLDIGVGAAKGYVAGSQSDIPEIGAASGFLGGFDTARSLGEDRIKQGNRSPYKLSELIPGITPERDREVILDPEQASKIKARFLDMGHGDKFNPELSQEQSDYVYRAISIDPTDKPILTKNSANALMRAKGFEFQRTPEEKAEIQNQQRAGRDLNVMEQNLPKLDQSLEKIERGAKGLPEAKPGLVGQVVSRARSAYNKFTKDPATEKYLGFIAQELSPLARNLAEEKGPLTDKDIDRIQAGLGDLNTPLETRRALLSELKTKIRLSLEGKAQVARIPVESLAEKYPFLYQDDTGQKTRSFSTVEEAEASGYKGPALIGGRKAVIE